MIVYIFRYFVFCKGACLTRTMGQASLAMMDCTVKHSLSSDVIGPDRARSRLFL